jgi:hypothetical protein
VSFYPQAGVPPQDVKDLSPIPELSLLPASSLVGEKAAILAVALHERTATSSARADRARHTSRRPR